MLISETKHLTKFKGYIKMFINKKIISLCFFIILINNHVTFSYWFDKESLYDRYVELKEMGKSFVNLCKLKRLKRQHQNSFDNFLIEQFAPYVSRYELKKLIKQNRKKKQDAYNFDHLYARNFSSGKHIEYDQIIERLSPEKIKLIRKIFKNHGVNPYAVTIISGKLDEGEITRSCFLKDQYPTIILNKNIAWEEYSSQQLSEIFNKDIQDLLLEHLFDFDNETVTTLVKKTHSQTKTVGEVKSLVTTMYEKYSQLKNETRKRISEIYTNA